MPLATQWNDAADKLTFCNYNSMDTASDCSDDLCFCTHMLDVELEQVIKHLPVPHYSMVEVEMVSFSSFEKPVTYLS